MNTPETIAALHNATLVEDDGNPEAVVERCDDCGGSGCADIGLHEYDLAYGQEGEECPSCEGYGRVIVFY